MSGIARVACLQGMSVSGSDLRQSRYTDQLVESGVKVFIGHDAAHLHALENLPDVVVVSTAILENNPELVEAKALGVPIWHRAKMLAYLGRDLKTLAVAGTHGKTTSSSMLATVLDAMGLDTTFLIGGMVRAYGTNAQRGTGDYYVVEADESDKSFTYLSPYAVMITNIEADHLDHYQDLNEIRSLFEAFIASVPDDGFAVVCGHDQDLVTLARRAAKRVVTYGFGDEFDASITSYEQQGVSSTFTLQLPDGKVVESGLLQNPGKHNVLNAAGVLTLIYTLGFDAAQAAECMKRFKGVKRRFDMVGECNGITIVDDYAHHPTEIKSTIQAAKQLGYNNVHVLFQPHRYSRAKLFCDVLKDEFASAFDDADFVTFMNVYSAGETPIPGITGKTFARTVESHEGHPPVHYVSRRIDTVDYLLNVLKPGDLIITMGAGDVTTIGPDLLMELRAQSETESGVYA